ncbi:DNA ligase 4 [Ceratobasidium sp. AG-Ba]|nr:DNA ligase 4 [Ceratobasidium sp. AG-Ba]
MEKPPKSHRPKKAKSPTLDPDQAHRPTRSGTPTLSDVVASLPIRLPTEHKLFLNPYIKDFKPRVAKRGTRVNNATAWARAFTTSQYIPHFFSDYELNTLDVAVLCEKVYNYFSNCCKRGTCAKAPKPIVQLRFFAHNSWRKAHPEDHNAAVAKLASKLYPNAQPNFGEQRALTPKAFKTLPESEQDHWKSVAKKEQARCQSAATLVDPFDIERYTDGLIKTLNSIIGDATKKIGACVTIQLVTKKGGNRFKLSRRVFYLTSDSMGEFNKSDALAIFLNKIKEHVESSIADGQFEDEPPEVDVMIDWETGKALVPEIAGMSVPRLRKLLRKLIKYIWAFQGGVGRFPWDEIARNPDKWIDPKRLPPGVDFKDTSLMSLSGILTFIAWIDAGNSGNLDNELVFQFLLVNAGPTPIDQATSEETDRQLLQFNGREVYLLTFEHLVTRCHAVGGIDAMPFSENAIAYTHFRQTGRLQLDRPLSYIAPTDWLGLPFGAEIPRTVFSGSEAETFFALAAMLPEEHGSRISNLFQLVNEHQSHLPASDEIGLWNCPRLPPQFIPQTSCDEPEDPFFSPSIGPGCFYKPPLSLEGTIGYFELWYGEVLKSGVLVHEPSRTLYGGNKSLGWFVRSLSLPYINICAAVYNIELPDPMPEGYDASRLPVSEWPRLIKWVDDTTQLIRNSIAILGQTSDSRALGLSPNHATKNANSDLDPNDHADPDPDLESSASPSLPPPLAKPRRSSKRKGKKPLRRIESDEEDDAELSDKSSDSDQPPTNYDLLDRPPSMESDDDLDLDNSHTAPDVPDVNQNEPGPSKVISRTEAPSGWRQQANAFGSFVQLKKYKSPSVALCYQSIIQALDKGDSNLASARQDFEAICRSYKEPLEIDLTSLGLYEDPDAHLLAEYILRRRAVWLRAKSLSQLLFDLDYRIHQNFRDTFFASGQARMWVELKESQSVAQDLSFPEVPVVEARVEAVDKSLAESRWAHNELRTFDALATKKLNELQGDWLQGTLPTDLPVLHQLVQKQLAWFDDFEQVKRDQIESRCRTWALVSNGGVFPVHHMTSGMAYPFGNPTITEEPVGIRDAFARVTRQLLHPASVLGAKSPGSNMETDKAPSAPSVLNAESASQRLHVSTAKPALSASHESSPTPPPIQDHPPISSPTSDSPLTSPLSRLSLPLPRTLPSLPQPHPPMSQPDRQPESPSNRSPSPPSNPSPSPPPDNIEQSKKRKRTINGSKTNADPDTGGRRVSARHSAAQREAVQPIATRSAAKRAAAAQKPKPRKAAGQK